MHRFLRKFPQAHTGTLGISDWTCPALGLCSTCVHTSLPCHFQGAPFTGREEGLLPLEEVPLLLNKEAPLLHSQVGGTPLLPSGQTPGTEAGLVSGCRMPRGWRVAWILLPVPPRCCCTTRSLREGASRAPNPVPTRLQCSPAWGCVREHLYSSESSTGPEGFRTVPAATSSRKPSLVPTCPAPRLWGKRGLGGQRSPGRARSRKRKHSALPVRSGRPCWSSGGGAEARPGSPRRRR